MAGWTISGSSPPLEASSFILERRLEPAGQWEPVLGKDDPVVGSIDSPPGDTAIFRGVDLMKCFPGIGEQNGSASRFAHRDTFLKGAEGEAEPSPPELGTMLRYRVTAIDSVGRHSSTGGRADQPGLPRAASRGL